MQNILTFLGKDSGFGKNNTSAYTIINDKLLLIDCGYTVFPQLQERNLLNNIREVHVIITHLHPDHAGSLSQLILFCYFSLKITVNVITECIEIDNFLRITGVSRFCNLPEPHKAMYTTKKSDFIKFIHTNHVAKVMDCYGFSAQINGAHIVYTGDTKSLDHFIPYLHEGSILFTDASIVGGAHLKLEDNLPLLIKLSNEGINVYLMHLDNEAEIRKIIKGTAIHICDD